MSKSSVTVLSTVLLMSLLTGCSKTDDKKLVTGDVSNPATTTTSTQTGDTATTTGAPATTSGAPATGVPKQIKVNLNDLPDDLVICTVGGTNINVADYRRMMRIQQAQLQTQVSVDPLLRMNLLEQAKKRNITLLPEERQKLSDAAKAQHKDFQAFLKERKITEHDFNNEVENAGLELKMANAMMEEGMLTQLLTRELLSAAAKSGGGEKIALAKYTAVKSNPNFEALQKQTGLKPDALRDELVKGELAKIQIDKLQKTIKVTEPEIKDFYEKNKNQLKHNERIRISSILVSCPEQDVNGVLTSVRTQIKNANPKLEGKELDATVALLMQQQQNKALILLGEAKGTKDFAKLANEHTDDQQVRIRKTGGDMGWQEKQQLVPEFAKEIWSVPPGTVFPKVVKTAEGFRIIKVVGHEKAGAFPLPEVRNVLEAKLKQDKLNGAVNSWIAQQQKVVKVEFSPKFLAVANGGKAPATSTN